MSISQKTKILSHNHMRTGNCNERKHDITPARIFWYANQNHGYYDSASL